MMGQKLRTADKKGSRARIAFIHAVTPHYRAAAFDLLLDLYRGSANLLTGRDHFDKSRRTELSRTTDVLYVPNVYVLGRRLLVQRRVLGPGVAADICVLDLNPRILTAWWLLLARRILRRPSIVWGHAWPRAGRKSWTSVIRSRFVSLADVVVTYTELEANQLRDSGVSAPVFTAPNALYRESQIRPSAGDGPGEARFIYVGRLTNEKNVDLALRALALISRGRDASLTIVGDGPLREGLAMAAAEFGVAAAVAFIPSVTDPSELRTLYSRVVASICPGPVGLALIQSLGFGVPMIFPGVGSHGPEIEAAEEGWNCITFAPASPEAMAAAMASAADDAVEWRARRDSIAAACRSRYSAEAMATGISSAIEAAMEAGKALSHAGRSG